MRKFGLLSAVPTAATARRAPMTILALLLAFGISAAHAAPIHTAARQGDVDTVRELLDQGEDINRNSRNGAPLHQRHTPPRYTLQRDRAMSIPSVSCWIRARTSIGIAATARRFMWRFWPIARKSWNF